MSQLSETNAVFFPLDLIRLCKPNVHLWKIKAIFSRLFGKSAIIHLFSLEITHGNLEVLRM